MKRIVKKGLLAATVFGTLTLGACVTDGYYSSGSVGYSSYPYSRPYVYPSSSVSFYYSSPRYYRGYYPRAYYPRYYGGRYYRHHGRYYGNRHYRHHGRYYGHGRHYNRPHHSHRSGYHRSHRSGGHYRHRR